MEVHFKTKSAAISISIPYPEHIINILSNEMGITKTQLVNILEYYKMDIEEYFDKCLTELIKKNIEYKLFIEGPIDTIKVPYIHFEDIESII